jgi:hypothetical protein
MGEAKDRTTYPHVVVDIEKVRASGLVKDTIGLDQHDEKGTFSTTLLREAVKTTRDFDSRWSAYCDTAGEPKVLPLMVIQVPDKSDSSKISEIVQVVESEWPGLGPNAIAHVFGEHEPVVLGSRIVSWVCPRIYPHRYQYQGCASQGGHLNWVGLPEGRGPLFRAASQRCHPYRSGNSAVSYDSRWRTE